MYFLTRSLKKKPPRSSRSTSETTETS